MKLIKKYLEFKEMQKNIKFYYSVKREFRKMPIFEYLKWKKEFK
jgi:hypothetical protein